MYYNSDFFLCCNPTDFLTLVPTDSNSDPLTDKIFYFYSVKVWKRVDIYMQSFIWNTFPLVCGRCF